MKKSRIDVSAGKELEIIFDIDSISYFDLQRIHYDFMAKKLLDESLMKKIGISESTFNLAVHENSLILKNLLGELFDDDMKNERIRLWEIHDSSDGVEKNLLKLLIDGFSDYEEFTKAIESYASVSMMISGTLFDALALGGEELCVNYAEFIKNHELMKKYKCR